MELSVKTSFTLGSDPYDIFRVKSNMLHLLKGKDIIKGRILLFLQCKIEGVEDLYATVVDTDSNAIITRNESDLTLLEDAFFKAKSYEYVFYKSIDSFPYPEWWVKGMLDILDKEGLILEKLQDGKMIIISNNIYLDLNRSTYDISYKNFDLSIGDILEDYYSYGYLPENELSSDDARNFLLISRNDGMIYPSWSNIDITRDVPSFLKKASEEGSFVVKGVTYKNDEFVRILDIFCLRNATNISRDDD